MSPLVFVRSSLLALQKDSEAGDVADTKGKRFYARTGSAQVHSGMIDKQLKQKAVAERLGLTVRQVRRLVERYELEGPRGLISKLRDRPGNRRLKPERAEEAFAIIRAQYADFGPTLAAEKLRELHGIDLAVETARPPDPSRPACEGA
jgi:hypothetical protein